MVTEALLGGVCAHTQGEEKKHKLMVAEALLSGVCVCVHTQTEQNKTYSNGRRSTSRRRMCAQK